MENISPQDRPLAVALLQQMYSRMTFDPIIVAALLLDVKHRRKIKDTRKGIRQAVFPGVDYDVDTKPHVFR